MRIGNPRRLSSIPATGSPRWTHRLATDSATGHSRTVAGYTQNLLALFGQIRFSGLVYDPWPPNAGVITRWENVATQTYQYAYSAVLQHV